MYEALMLLGFFRNQIYIPFREKRMCVCVTHSLSFKNWLFIKITRALFCFVFFSFLLLKF